jgi:hypothetical protein
MNPDYSVPEWRSVFHRTFDCGIMRSSAPGNISNAGEKRVRHMSSGRQHQIGALTDLLVVG